MADNTISPVVPNVSGGRNVSTGQKAVTQTAAQSGIDFKSYLGGRTAVQDNSTTFLKRRNSYTLNKNNTKEISIKTASKNSPTESEVKKITDDISSQIVEKVTDDLDISEDELNNAMQLLGLTAMDLLNPANLSALYCEVTGNASDPQALVLNADFTALFNDVSQVASENDAQLDLLSQLTASDDGEILDADIVSSADTTEKTVDSSYDDTAASGQNINDTADEAVKVYDGGTQDSSYQNSDEGTSSGETGNGITSDEKTQSKSLADSSFDDSGERVLHHDDGTHSDNSMLHASVSEQLNTDTSFEMSQSQSRLRVDTTNIIRHLAIIQALMVEIRDEIYAIALGSISNIEDIPVKDIKYVQAKEVIHLRGSVIPIIRLDKMLDIEPKEQEPDHLTVVIVQKGDQQAGLVVDNLIGQQEIVIKSLGKYINGNKLISGATILGDGDVALILDVNTLM